MNEESGVVNDKLNAQRKNSKTVKLSMNIHV